MMKISKRKVLSITIGISFILTGIYTIIDYMFPAQFIKIIFVVALLILGVLGIISIFANRPKFKNNIVHYLSPFVLIGLAIFLYNSSYLFVILFPILFGLWSIINAILCGINTYLFKKDKVKLWFVQLIYSVLYLLVGIGLIISPLIGFRVVNLFIALYLFLFGVSILRENIFPTIVCSSNNRRKKILLPIFVVAFIPQKVMDKINDKLKGITREERKKLNNAVNEGKRITVNNSLDNNSKMIFDRKLENTEQDILEVFVHLSENTALGFGHCDICFNNTVISYGCYDESSNRLFGTISDGVLVTNKRKEYIEYCLEQEKKILVGFEIDLTAEQSVKVKDKIKELYNESYRWYCNAERGNKIVDENLDPASALYKKTGAKFYKFHKGEFKTYFVTGSNCVKVADYVVGAAGIDSVNSGIITPGTYFALLDSAFKRKDGSIKSEHIYLDPKNKIK